MQPASYWIPLKARDRSIRAFTVVDGSDYARVAHLNWTLSGHGYATGAAKINGRWRTLLLHRVILGLPHGDRRQGDHIDRDRLNNRRSNLRIVAGDLNRQNIGSRGGSSKYRGVSWDRAERKWVAECKIGNRRRYLGRFASELEAARVAAEFRAVHMPYSEEVPIP
jgi:hypothetical protein